MNSTAATISRRGNGRIWLLGVLCILVLFVAAAMVIRSIGPREANSVSEQVAAANPPQHLHEIKIRKPRGTPVVKLGASDPQGREATASCSTCHTTKPANLEARVGIALPAFHQGLSGQHANLACVACHHPGEGYDALRLADGRSLPYTEVMTLCAQCHGPQFRDYQHGAHGGMTGYWDLNRGPRFRNNCIDCHDPHSPRYPIVQPAPRPRDRDPSAHRSRGTGHD